MNDTDRPIVLQNSLHDELARTRHQLATANGQRYALELERDELRSQLKTALRAWAAGTSERDALRAALASVLSAITSPNGATVTQIYNIVKPALHGVDRAGAGVAAASELVPEQPSAVSV